MEAMDRGVLGSIKYGVKDAEHTGDDELTWRVLSQAITRRTADDCVDGDHVETDIGGTVWPETTKAEIVVDAAVRENDAAALEFAGFLENQDLVEGREKRRVGRRRSDCMGNRYVVAMELAPAPGP